MRNIIKKQDNLKYSQDLYIEKFNYKIFTN